MQEHELVILMRQLPGLSFALETLVLCPNVKAGELSNRTVFELYVPGAEH